jgi:hypothetical protein
MFSFYHQAAQESITQNGYYSENEIVENFFIELSPPEK